MNTRETSAIRELTQVELDSVAGGSPLVAAVVVGFAVLVAPESVTKSIDVGKLLEGKGF